MFKYSRIKALREQKGLKQKDLCNEILTKSTLSKIENGKVSPTVEQLEHILKILNVKTSCFFEEEDDIIIHSSASKDCIKLKEIFENGKYQTERDYKFMDSKSFKEFIQGYSDLSDEFKIMMLKEALETYNTLGKIAHFKNDKKTAFKYFHSAYKLYKELNYSKVTQDITEELNKIAYNIALYYYNDSDYKKCIDFTLNFLKDSGNFIHNELTPSLYSLISSAYYMLNDLNDSLINLEKAITLFKMLNFNHKIPICEINRINIYISQDKFNEALECADHFIDETSNDIVLNQRFKMQKSIVYFNIKDYKSCRDTLKSVVFNKLSKDNKRDYRFMLAHIEFTEGNFDPIKNFHKTYKSQYEEKRLIPDLCLILQDLYEITMDYQYIEKIIDLKDRPYQNRVAIKYDKHTNY